MRRRG
ncbi:hypothetical protein E2C01_073604 [Portunus trituberculatus]|jgi:hypothetical protein